MKHVIRLFLIMVSVITTLSAIPRYPGEEVPFHQGLSLLANREEALYKQHAAEAALHLREPNHQERAYMDTFMSFNTFMEECLHNPDWGYYGAGSVVFRPENLQGHFVTVPKQVSPAFGAMLAYQAYAMWRSMIISGDSNEQEPFYLIEFGAGDGDLAFDILSSLERNAAFERDYNLPTQWRAFYGVTRYIIGERAPALCTRQKERNKKFIEAGKCEIINTDARQAKKHIGENIKGVVLSNELLDTFCLHKVLAPKGSGSWKTCYVIPVLNKQFFEQNKVRSLKRYEKIFEERDRFNRSTHETLLTGVPLGAGDLVLTQQDYLMLKSHEKKHGANVEPFLRLIDTYVIDTDCLPELETYLKRHKHYLQHLVDIRDDSRNRFFYINHSAPQFIQEVAGLLDKGFVITIDYGDTTQMHDWQLTFHSCAIRMYPEKSGPYQSPGSADITSDVNFSDLYVTGKACGLEVCFFGSQRALQGNSVLIGDNIVLPAFDMRNELFAPVIADDMIDYFRSSVSSQMFKMLVQKKVSPLNRYQIMTESEPLFPVW